MFPETAKTGIETRYSESSIQESPFKKAEDVLRKTVLQYPKKLLRELEKLDPLNTGKITLDTLDTAMKNTGLKNIPTKSELRLLWNVSIFITSPCFNFIK